MTFPDDFHPRGSEIFRRESSTVWLEDGIVFIYAHPNCSHSLSDAKAHNQHIEDLLCGKRVPMICDVRQARPMDKKVRKYYETDEGTRNCSKFAYIVGSPVSRVIANFFIGFSKITYPMQMFTSVRLATEWCRED